MAEDAADLHVPVMAGEMLSCLRPETGGLYVDGTLGLGGHCQAILKASAPSGRVIGFEWDCDAADLAADRLSSFADRLTIVRSSYADMETELLKIGVESIDGLLVDLGVSSLQLDRAERGFSFRVDAPLDMRMDRTLELDAVDILARSSEEELADIFYYYGEERQARRIAAHICKARKSSPIKSTKQLADLVASAVPRRFHPEKIHVATRVFQALRIAVNRELDNLVRLLNDAPNFLSPGAAFCVITFHSLEDRIVKQAFRKDERLKVVRKRPIRAQDEEVAVNPRARSAKLRSAVRQEE